MKSIVRIKDVKMDIIPEGLYPDFKCYRCGCILIKQNPNSFTKFASIKNLNGIVTIMWQMFCKKCSDKIQKVVEKKGKK